LRQWRQVTPAIHPGQCRFWHYSLSADRRPAWGMYGGAIRELFLRQGLGN